MANLTLLQAFEVILTAAKEYIDNNSNGGATAPQDEIVLTEYSTNQDYILEIQNGQPVVRRKN